MISHHDNSSLHILPLRWHSCDALLSQLCRKSANYFCRTLLDRNVRFWHFRERFESFIAAVIRVSAVAGKNMRGHPNYESKFKPGWFLKWIYSGQLISISTFGRLLFRLLVDFYRFDLWSILTFHRLLYTRLLSISLDLWPLVKPIVYWSIFDRSSVTL